MHLSEAPVYSTAYEALRESGCVALPSQRTLRDYTHFVKAASGFSTAVDQQLMEAADIHTCEERDKYVVLILHIKQELVYDKQTGVLSILFICFIILCYTFTLGALIGFVNLGEVNNHLIAYEQSILDEPSQQKLANSMMVIMVRGLFSQLEFPYVQFPCKAVTGDLLESIQPILGGCLQAREMWPQSHGCYSRWCFPKSQANKAPWLWKGTCLQGLQSIRYSGGTISVLFL